MLRTIVVASATISILFVCFSIYQYSQISGVTAPKVQPRLPPTPKEPESFAASLNPAQIPAVTVGSANVGPGRNVKLSIYAPEGNRARFEVAVASWTPVPGALNEFSLAEPEIRLRSGMGNAVRVTAKKGVLEAQRRSGGSLEPLRGRLNGEVLIEFDRLTDPQRAKLDEPRRSIPDPSELILIRMDEIAFDLEYAKVSVPGELQLTGHDVTMKADDLEIRLNPAGNKIEYVRISRGGRIELCGFSDRLGVGVESAGGRAPQSTSITDWLRATLEAHAAKTAGANAVAVPAAPSPAGAVAVKEPSGIPVFRRDGTSNVKPVAPPQHYFARFEEQVRAELKTAGKKEAELRADALEILRQISDDDRKQTRAETPSNPSTQRGREPKAEEWITIEWNGRLTVEGLRTDDPRRVEGVRSKVTAIGAPAVLSSRDGEASGSRLIVEPDSGSASLLAEGATPVILRSPEEETLHGRQVFTRRVGDTLTVSVTGPGKLVRSPASAPVSANSPADTSEAAIEFADQLEVTGRYITQTRMGLSGTITSQELRTLDSARFRGSVRLREDSTAASADEIVVHFNPDRAGRRNQQSIDRVEANGHVTATQGEDRLSSRELELTLSTDRRGRSIPLTMIAKGDVTAGQGDRTIQARDRLHLEFESVESASQFAAVAPAHDHHGPPVPLTTDRPEDRAGSRHADLRTEAAVRRVLAEGGVRIADPSQFLELVAERVDAEVEKGRNLQTVLVEGPADRPATVSIKTLSVTGERIKLNVPDEWAEVPGAGRMTFRANKDLDGRRLAEPVPIVVTWKEWMKYQGRENKATFSGNVHATSKATTTFDSDRLFIEFDDVATPPAEETPVFDWSYVRRLADRFRVKPEPKKAAIAADIAAKEPAYLLATGNVSALTSEWDADSGKIKNRVSIRGPRLSLNLRKEVSKMLIDGAGNLLIEDYRPAVISEPAAPTPDQSLLSFGGGQLPSGTLIEWQEMMWYDFSIEQTRFESKVHLKHFSGSEFERLVQTSAGGSSTTGRSTFLECDVLTSDFGAGEGRRSESEPPRMGGLSAGRLRQFQALGNVQLQDPVERLWLSAESLGFERDRELLAVHGSQSRKARIVLQRTGEYPQDYSAERFFYNLATKVIETSEPLYKGR